MIDKSLNEVQKVLEIFLEGTKELDYDKMISVVHPDARMYLGNQFESKLLYEHWKNTKTMSAVEKKNYSDNFTSEILSIEIEGTIALAKTTMNNWVDFLSFIKIDNAWKMVVKVSHRRTE